MTSIGTLFFRSSRFPCIKRLEALYGVVPLISLAGIEPAPGSL